MSRPRGLVLQGRITNLENIRRIWTKAYMVEFYAGENSQTPGDVFTFALPPQSEELKWGQRKSETKTFGGLHVAEYGADEARVTLHGSTANQLLKRVHGGADRDDKWLSGEAEIYEFRDLLLRHRELGNLRGAARGKIIIRDLSKTAVSAFGGSGSGPVAAAWRAYPGEFSIRRDSDKPFAYKYSFEFTAVAQGPQAGSPPGGAGPSLRAALDGARDAVNRAYTVVENITHKMADALAKVTGGLGEIESLLFDMGEIALMPQGMAAGALTGVLQGTSGVMAGANHLAGAPAFAPARMIDGAARVQAAAEGVRLAGLEFGSLWREGAAALRSGDPLGVEIYEEAKAATGVETAACEVTAAAKSGADGEALPDGSRAYSFYAVPAKEGDSLESMAAAHLGSPDKAALLAACNGIGSIEDLGRGDAVKIPVTARPPAGRENGVHARHGDRDGYGRDILIGAGGFLAVSPSGDFALVSGAANLSQAVLLRLRESSRRRLRLTSYGIRKNIGDPDMARAHILASIRETVSADPRVERVDSVRFAASGDSLSVEVGYTDITGGAGFAAGEA